jgi:molybdate transport system regulatory protein
MAQMAGVEVTFVFGSGARISPVAAKLLAGIRATGSISAASRGVGVPYKKAWVLLDGLNKAFDEPVSTAAPGGTGGGGATLTPFGAEVLARYQCLADKTAELAAEDIKALSRRARPGTPQATASQAPRKRGKTK